LGGRKGIWPVKTKRWGAGVVICLERGADLHMAQLMPLPLTVSCFSKIQIDFIFLVRAHPDSPRKRAFKRGVCVSVVIAFNAFTLLVGHQEEHPACKNWLTDWRGYLSGARCRLFAYGPAGATVSPKHHHLLPHLNLDWFYLSGTGLTRLSWKRGR